MPLRCPTFRRTWRFNSPPREIHEKEPILTMKNCRQAMLAGKATKINPSPSPVIAPFPAPRPPASSRGLATGALRPGGASARLSRAPAVLHQLQERLQKAGDTAEPRPLRGGGGDSSLAPRGGEVGGSPGRTAPRRDRGPRAVRAAVPGRKIRLRAPQPRAPSTSIPYSPSRIPQPPTAPPPYTPHSPQPLTDPHSPSALRALTGPHSLSDPRTLQTLRVASARSPSQTPHSTSQTLHSRPEIPTAPHTS